MKWLILNINFLFCLDFIELTLTFIQSIVKSCFTWIFLGRFCLLTPHPSDNFRQSHPRTIQNWKDSWTTPPSIVYYLCKCWRECGWIRNDSRRSRAHKSMITIVCGLWDRTSWHSVGTSDDRHLMGHLLLEHGLWPPHPGKQRQLQLKLFWIGFSPFPPSNPTNTSMCFGFLHPWHLLFYKERIFLSFVMIEIRGKCSSNM